MSSITILLYNNTITTPLKISTPLKYSDIFFSREESYHLEQMHFEINNMLKKIKMTKKWASAAPLGHVFFT